MYYHLYSWDYDYYHKPIWFMKNVLRIEIVAACSTRCAQTLIVVVLILVKLFGFLVITRRHQGVER